MERLMSFLGYDVDLDVDDDGDDGSLII